MRGGFTLWGEEGPGNTEGTGLNQCGILALGESTPVLYENPHFPAVVPGAELGTARVQGQVVQITSPEPRPHLQI